MQAVLVLLVTLLMVSCTKEETKKVPVDIPDFGNYISPKNSTSELKTAAKAVVRIGDMIRGPLGTGSFISEDGLLMTNEHVLGDGNCTSEGCSVTLDFNYEKGQAFGGDSNLFFAKPLTADKNLDVALYQVYDAENGTPLSTPDYLKFVDDVYSLNVGDEVHVIGHPMAALKKIKTAAVMELDEFYVNLDDYVFGGNSGSPIVNDNGQIVGIIHRSANRIGRISKRGLQAFSVGSNFVALKKFLNLDSDSITPKSNDVAVKEIFFQPASLPSQSDLIDRVKISPALGDLYVDMYFVRNRAENSVVAGKSFAESILEGAAEGCEKEIKDAATNNDSSFTYDNNFRYCALATRVIECREDNSPIANLKTCPANSSEWSDRAERILQIGANRYNDISWVGRSLLSKTSSMHASIYRMHLSEVTGRSDLTFFNAFRLIGAGLPNTHGALDKVIEYRNDPFHQKHLYYIYLGQFYLYSMEVLTKAQLQELTNYVFANPNLTMREMFNIEELVHTDARLRDDVIMPQN